MASISTVIFPGRELKPTAERACRPVFPKTCIIRSEQPLITVGCSVKSGAAFTMPRSFTIRSTRSRSPRNCSMTAMSTRPVRRASRQASSQLTSMPTLPVDRVPSARSGPWPDRKSSPPYRLHGRKLPTGRGTWGSLISSSSRRCRIKPTCCSSLLSSIDACLAVAGCLIGLLAPPTLP